MYELQKEAYPHVRSLLDSGHLHPEVLSIMNGTNPGWIFADHDTAPRSALVWSQGMQGFYLIGDHTNREFIDRLDGFISSTIIPRMSEWGLDCFEVSGHHDNCDLNGIFPARELHFLNKRHSSCFIILLRLSIKTFVSSICSH